MGKKGVEFRELRRSTEVEPPYDLTPYEDLQEAPGDTTFDEQGQCRVWAVERSEGIPRQQLGRLRFFYRGRHILVRCE